MYALRPLRASNALRSIFAFDLNTDESGTHLPSVTEGGTTTYITQVTNDIPTDTTNTALATFGIVSFTQDDVRDAPYVYVITENQTTHVSGYTYSPDVKLIMPVLVDNEDGTLSMRTGLGSSELFNISGTQTAGGTYVDHDGDEGTPAVLRLEPTNQNVIFNNSYSTDYTTQTISAIKTNFSETNAYQNGDYYVVNGIVPLPVRLAYTASIMYNDLVTTEYADSIFTEYLKDFVGSDKTADDFKIVWNTEELNALIK